MTNKARANQKLPATSVDAEVDVLRPFRPSDLPIYQGWFADPETRRWVACPDERWLAHVLAGGRSACWVLEDAGLPGGILQVDWDEGGCAYVSVVTDPAKRRRGLGARLLLGFLATQSQDFAAVTASVEPDNRASLAVARRCGFEQTGVDEEGFVQLRYRKTSGEN